MLKNCLQHLKHHRVFTSQNFKVCFVIFQQYPRTTKGLIKEPLARLLILRINVSRAFATGDESLHQPKIYHSPSPTWKHPPSRLPPYQRLIPPPSCHNKIKTFIFSCSHCSCTIFNVIFFIHKGHTNFHFNWCLIFTKSCFWLWKRFDWWKSLLLWFPPPGKKIPQENFHIWL